MIRWSSKQQEEPTLYQELIDALFREKHEEREPDGRLHPSSLSDCERAGIYSSRGEPRSNETDIRSIRIMARGTQMHEEIQQRLVQQHPGTLLEVDVDHGAVKGSADALVPVGDGRHYDEVGNPEDVLQPLYELQEFKSISPMGKRYLKGSPKEGHMKQARVYHWALGHQGYLLEDHIRITYFDRDDWSVTEFEVPCWTQAEAETWEMQLASLEAHLMDGTLPPKMPDDFWLCRYCDYRTTCKGVE